MKTLLAVAALFVLAGGAAEAQQVDEIDWIGTWRVFMAEGLSGYSLNDHRNGHLDQTAAGELTLEPDGGIAHTLEDFDYDSWRYEDGFLVLEQDGTNAFHAVRALSPDVLYLVNVTVTERNREVIRIRTNRRFNMLVLRE